MKRKNLMFLLSAVGLIGIILSGCYSYGPRNRLYTPVPTLIPAEAHNPLEFAMSASIVIRCPVRPVNLLGAWVEADVPEAEPFEFAGEEDQICAAGFEQDILPIFTQSNLWYEGAPACVSCHHADLEISIQNMDLSSYEGILAGSQRTSPDEEGNDILGGGDWEASRLHEVLVTRQMPPGRPADSPAEGPVIFAGSPVSE